MSEGYIIWPGYGFPQTISVPVWGGGGVEISQTISQVSYKTWYVNVGERGGPSLPEQNPATAEKQETSLRPHLEMGEYAVPGTVQTHTYLY